MPTDDLLGTLFGTMLAAALTIVVMSRFLHLVKRIITPLVTGIVVLLIGLTLIKVGLISMGAATAPWRTAASPVTPTSSLLLVLGLIVLMQRSRNPPGCALSPS